MILQVDQVREQIVAQVRGFAVLARGRSDDVYGKGRRFDPRLGQQRLQVVRDKDKLTGHALVLAEGAKDQARIPQLFGGAGRFLPGRLAFQPPRAGGPHLTKSAGKIRSAHPSSGCLYDLQCLTTLGTQPGQGHAQRQGFEKQGRQLVGSFRLAIGAQPHPAALSQSTQHRHVVVIQEPSQVVHLTLPKSLLVSIISPTFAQANRPHFRSARGRIRRTT